MMLKIKKPVKPLKIAFLDRDGTLIAKHSGTAEMTPGDAPKLLPGVVEGLTRLIEEGYGLVMIAQGGEKTGLDPEKRAGKNQGELVRQFRERGVEFYEILVCSGFSKMQSQGHDDCVSVMQHFLDQEKVDLEHAVLVGDEDADMALARQIGVWGIPMKPNGPFPRIASVTRVTRETDVFVQCNLDGKGVSQIEMGLKFFSHMLEQLAKNALIDLRIRARGDLDVDEHHLIEDVGLTLGQTLSRALGMREGIMRYGFLLPMDDTLVEVAVDLGGRPYLVFQGEFQRERVGDLPTEMVEHFFRSLSDTLRANIHIHVRYSRNEHHKVEAIFKALGRALRMACEADPRSAGTLPSTKGIL